MQTIYDRWLTPAPECNNPWSPRCVFLWNALLAAEGPVLDVGCADDPLFFGEQVTHFDIDDWSQVYEPKVEKFVQGDVHHLDQHFEWGSFDTVLLGDVVEHLYAPSLALAKCARVAARALAFTVWEETRIAQGPGLWVVEGQAAADRDAQLQGAQDREHWQRQHYPLRVGVPDDEVPHLTHIWQFSQEMVDGLVGELVRRFNFHVRFFQRVPEVEHEGTWFYDWLVYLEREHG